MLQELAREYLGDSAIPLELQQKTTGMSSALILKNNKNDCGNKMFLRKNTSTITIVNINLRECITDEE